MIKLDLSFWTKASSKRKRVYIIMFMFVLAAIVTFVTSYIPISQSNATSLVSPLNSTEHMHESNGTLPEYIFLNNFEICLAMFIPIIGPLIGFIVLGSTGYVLGAISKVQGYPPWVAILSLLLSPDFWLEYIAYSTAMAESIWLTRRLFQGRIREVKNTAILIGICAVTLIVSAFIEAWLISLGI